MTFSLPLASSTPMRTSALWIAVLALAVTAQAQTTFTVTSAADAGAGSLRQAITDANANAGADVIAFNLAGAGPHILDLDSDLPPVTDPITIDGLTQTGAQCGAWPATLQVVLVGEGISLDTDDSLVRGLVVQAASFAVAISGSRNAVECMFIGTNAAGTDATSQQRMRSTYATLQPASGETCSGNRFGGPAVSQRNVFGSSGVSGVSDACNGTVYQGNYFGISAAGDDAPFSVFKPHLSLAGLDYVIGGSAPGEGNAFARGDLLGSAGSVQMGSGRVQGNTFGTLPDGSPLPNLEQDVLRGGAYGLNLGPVFGEATDVLVGGTAPGAGNLFQGLAFGAIRARFGQNETPKRVAILGNRMYDNHNFRGTGRELTLQVDIGEPGARRDYSGILDGNTSAIPPRPDLADLPTLTDASSARVRGTLQHTPGQSYRIEAFAGGGCGLQRMGKARFFLGAFDVTTDGSGLATFDETIATSSVPAGEVVAVTATSVIDGSAENGLTSELSACAPTPSDSLLVTVPYDFSTGFAGEFYSVLPGSLPFALQTAEAREGADVIRFAIPTDQDLPGCDATTGVCEIIVSQTVVTHPVTIDGLSQPGASCDTWPASLGIALVGTDGGSALVFESDDGRANAAGSELRGVAVYGASFAQVRVNGGAFRLTCSHIGTDASGTKARGGRHGVYIAHAFDTREAGTVQIGGPALSDRNLISGSTRGIHIRGGRDNLLPVRIENNWIGPDANGDAGIGNVYGIDVDTGVDAVTRIGGTENGMGNVIAHNEIVGIVLQEETNVGIDKSTRNVSILGNAIYANDADSDPRQVGPPIQLSPARAPLPNDPGDADEGANRRQNTPVITSAGALGGGLQVSYRVDTDPANATYPLRVEFFEATTDDVETGARRYLGHDTYTAADFGTGADKDVRVPARGGLVGGEVVVATATDADGNTSELSATSVSVGDESEAEGRQLELAVGPNPAHGAVSVRWTLPVAGPVDLRVFDVLGREVAVLHASSTMPSGVHDFLWDASGAAPGVYGIRLQAGPEVRMRRLTVVR
ncbi:MAG: hypothetical protein Rubg2KO_24670 [Rubricoccaceae bacterium]